MSSRTVIRVKVEDGQKLLFCVFERGEAELSQIASSGTVTLAQFYLWYLRLQNASFAFVDDFDVFYHFEVATALVRLLRELKHTQILLTAHSTDLMSNDLLRPDCYFLLRNNRIASLPSLTEKELRQAHNLQRMYKAGAFLAGVVSYPLLMRESARKKPKC